MLAQLLAEGETVTKLPIPPAGFGLLALAFFGALLVILFAFRGVSNRH